jgi:hypothetical protein
VIAELFISASAEMDLLKAFQVLKFCRKELWVFKDYHRNPEIVDLKIHPLSG